MWLFDGDPEMVSAMVPDASAQVGGYIMVFVLTSGEPRIVATRFPGKNVTSWKSRSARYRGEELHRVLVSPPHPRYEKLKRILALQLSHDEVGDPHPGPLTMEHVTSKVEAIFASLSANHANHQDHGTRPSSVTGITIASPG